MNDEWLKEAEKLLNEYASDLRAAERSAAGFDRIGLRSHGAVADESRAELMAHLASAAVPAVQPQEPVAWMIEDNTGYRGLTFIDPQTAEGAWDGFTITPLYVARWTPEMVAQVKVLADEIADAFVPQDSVHLTEPKGESVTARSVPPGKWKVDMPDGICGKLPGDPPGPCDVRKVIGGYVYFVTPRTGELVALNPPSAAALSSTPAQGGGGTGGVKTSDGGQPK